MRIATKYSSVVVDIMRIAPLTKDQSNIGSCILTSRKQTLKPL